MQIVIRGDTRQIERAIEQHGKAAKASAVWSLNRITSQAQTSGVKKLAQNKRLPVRLVKSRTKVLRANFRKLSTTLIALTAGVPVDRLKYRDTKKRGVTAAGQRFPHAFEVMNNGGRMLVFERKVIGGNRVGRLPIERVKIPLNPQAKAIFEHEVRRAVESKLSPTFARELQRRLKRQET